VRRRRPLAAALLAAVIAAGTAGAQEVASLYTGVSEADCMPYGPHEGEPEIDSYTAECPALGGYRLLVDGGDLRYHPVVIYGERAVEPTIFAFHDLGAEVVEWRYRLSEEAPEPYALIYRIAYQRPQGEDFVTRDMLVVVALRGEESCLLGAVTPEGLPDGLTMNEAAREMADRPFASCLEEDVPLP